MNILKATAAATLTMGVALAAAAPASAYGPNPKVSVSGLGTHSSGAGAATYSGYSYAELPFQGEYSGVVTVTDGSFPPLGECEPATATVRVDEDGGNGHVELAASGEVCGILVGAWTMQRFEGRWTVASTSVKKIARSEGVVDLRLLSDGQADLYVWGR